MPTLSSSIVKQHVASVREVEEALARQVIYGGDLVTNLLELAPVSEPPLTLLLAESYGLPPAPAGELPVAAESVQRMVPGELALRHGFYPLVENDGTLTIAVCAPLPAEVEGDLGFSLGVSIVQRAAPLVRIRQALTRDYGLPLDRRFLRLVAKLEGRPDPSPSSMPPPLRKEFGFPKLPRPASVPPIGYPAVATLRSGDSGAPASSAEAEVAARAMAPAPAPRSLPRPALPLTTDTLTEAGAAREQVKTLIAARAPTDRQSSAPPRAKPSWPPAPRERGRTRHRGPYTAAMAEQDLLEADQRDQVTRAFFDFASQYFEYSALFAVQGDLAEGRDAHGPGADAERIRAIGVPLELPSALSAAKSAGTFQLASLGTEGLDASLATDLARKPGRVVLLLPVVVRGRAVLLLYGDHGELDVSLADVGDVIAFAPLVAAAFERVIVKRKLGAKRGTAATAGGSLTPLPLGEIQRHKRAKLPAVEERVGALARALDRTSAPSRPSRPPITAEESPQAKQTRPSSPAPATVDDSPQARARMAAPSTARESPDAKPRASGTAYPLTPDESPGAKRRARESDAGAASHSVRSAPVVAIGGPRSGTPPQGTPRLLEPTGGPEQTPFPLTRRTPSGRFLPVAEGSPLEPSSDELVDAGWDAAPSAGPGTKPGLGRPEATGKPSPSSGKPRLELSVEVEHRSDVGHEAPLAPSSRQVALGPMAPFRRQDASDRLLPAVMVDAEADCRELVASLVSGHDSAEFRLVELGEQAVSLLCAEFPGPILPEKQRRLGEQGATASECGPVLRALARIGPTAVPYLVVRTADRDPAVRRWATWLLGEMATSEAARAVVRRFGDTDPDVRRSALAAGRAMQDSPEARTALRDGLAMLASDPHQPSDTRHGCIEALADLRDARAVPRLIPLLASDNAAIARSALWALETLTRQYLGPEPQAWSEWWKLNGDRHRIEWLIDALDHPSAEIRRVAGEELKSTTNEYFGYYEDLPPEDRARSQQRYREWWSTRGKAKYRA